jgi:deazaflavin-dependent oxidoreductase (nitroreductase family)
VKHPELFPSLTRASRLKPITLPLAYLIESRSCVGRPYRLGFWRRLVNLIVRSLLRFGLSPPRTYLLTVPGRRTGKPHSTPVTLVEEKGERWLVAPYGEVGWVKNARAAGKVTLARGSRSGTVRIIELAPSEALGC